MSIQDINLGSSPNDGTGDGARSAGQKINSNFSYLDNKLDVFATTFKPIQQTYDDITALLAGQGNQTEGFLQKVTDASADPNVTSGIAYYEKLAASTADLDDYDRLTNEQAQALELTPENRFTVDDITDSAPTDVDPLKVKIQYDNGDDSVVGILFPAVFSLYLANMDALDTAIADFSFNLYNKTKNKWYGGVACKFTLVNTAFYKVDFGSATVDRTDFDVNDVVEVYFNAYKVSAASTLYHEFACSDETSDLETGTVYSQRLLRAFTNCTAFNFGVVTAPTGSTIIIDVKKNGTTIFDTKPTIDIGEFTTLTAATPQVLTGGSVSFAVGDLLEVIIDQIGSTTAGINLKAQITYNS